MWRSECTGSSNPTIFDIDVTFSHYFWTMAYQKRRYPLVNNLYFTIDNSNRLVTFTVTGSTRTGKETSRDAVNDATGRFVTLSRTVHWRN